MTATATENSTSDPPQSALARKTQVGRVEHQTRAMSVPKALRLTLAKVADDLFDMAMAAIGVRMALRGGEALGDLFEGDVLLMSLDGPAGRNGAAVFDAAFVGALIQQQTMGTVLPEPEGAARVLTATDAAISAPFLDALLERAALLPETEEERQLLHGFRFGIRAENARLLQMTLEAPDYQIVHITVDIAGGKRQGQIILCLPNAPKARDTPTGRKGDGDQGASPRRQKLLNATVMGLTVDLNVALARISMPLSAVGALAPGDVLELGVTSFDQSRILTMSGCGVGRGTLGQIDGKRAVRVDHQKVVTATPKRRASDRDDLDLPKVSGDGTGTRKDDQQVPAGNTNPKVNPSQTRIGDTMESLPEASELPDMSDLPGLDDDDEYAAVLSAQAG